MPKEKLTYEKLHEILHYDPDTGIFVWKKQVARHIKVGDIAGCDAHGYIRIGIYGKLYYAQRLAWMYVHGYFPEKDIDHLDRIRHHNCINNLREASMQCNIRNTGNRTDNTSGVKGVSWNKEKNKWQARIAVDGVQKNLGYFKDFDEAVCARLSGEQCLGWSGCDSSSPAYQYVQKILEGGI